jgi:uncharacterized membrane protein
MPYSWSEVSLDGPRHLTLRPHRSLGPQGFAAFIALTALLLAVPLLALMGGPALWFVLAFAIPAVWAVWTALRRNVRDGLLTEELTLTRDEARLTRRAPGGTEQTWTANPYWVRVTLYPTEGPVPEYLTLTGGDREVELGSFLSPDERQRLATELRDVLASLH